MERAEAPCLHAVRRLLPQALSVTKILCVQEGAEGVAATELHQAIPQPSRQGHALRCHVSVPRCRHQLVHQRSRAPVAATAPQCGQPDPSGAQSFIWQVDDDCHVLHVVRDHVAGQASTWPNWSLSLT